MAEWVKAAEVQLELHRWLTSQVGKHWMDGWMEAEKRANPSGVYVLEMLSMTEPYKLLTADSIWVAPEICDVITAAREGFQPEPIEREDFIVPTGFCYFATPLLLHDRGGKTVSVGAMSWCPTQYVDEGGNTLEGKEGMALSLFSSAFAVEDHWSAEHREYMAAALAIELTPLHFTSLVFGEPLILEDIEDESARDATSEWWRTVQTTFRLMQQRVADPHQEVLPRATRKRVERAKLNTREVLVIRLRRPASSQAEDTEHTVDWTHRWIVDGHWRNQWYPTLNRHRQIWISPYVKGPDDVPLVVKKRYYKWDR